MICRKKCLGLQSHKANNPGELLLLENYCVQTVSRAAKEETAAAAAAGGAGGGGDITTTYSRTVLAACYFHPLVIACSLLWCHFFSALVFFP
jgi:hypothetical protein